MYSQAIESLYPLSFRKEDALTLGNHLRHRHSVSIVGMKRVGISNFLRFFLSHNDFNKTYIKDDEKHIFVLVDLNDLVEREILPFWILTLKRIVDTLQVIDVPLAKKKEIENLFLKTIQMQDHFMAIDSVRQAFIALSELGFMPTLFLLHFDRIKDVVNPAFFDNLEGLINDSGHKLAYIFTSYRSLDQLSPKVFSQNALPFFSHNMYLSLASFTDLTTIIDNYMARYNQKLNKIQKEALINASGGHVQYLQLGLFVLLELEKNIPESEEEIYKLLRDDERIILQSEELWESLTEYEQAILTRFVRDEEITDKEKTEAIYLWESYIINTLGKKKFIFSPIFAEYLFAIVSNQPSNTQSVYFSKKENALFSLLKDRVGEICERDEIISSVWPEYGEVGISDWAIDRLVARVRAKLRQQKSKYEIRTIRTRGYQLLQK